MKVPHGDPSVGTWGKRGGWSRGGKEEGRKRGRERETQIYKHMHREKGGQRDRHRHTAAQRHTPRCPGKHRDEECVCCGSEMQGLRERERLRETERETESVCVAGQRCKTS